jgi:hypothetical protein
MLTSYVPPNATTLPQLAPNIRAFRLGEAISGRETEAIANGEHAEHRSDKEYTKENRSFRNLADRRTMTISFAPTIRLRGQVAAGTRESGDERVRCREFTHKAPLAGPSDSGMGDLNAIHLGILMIAQLDR